MPRLLAAGCGSLWSCRGLERCRGGMVAGLWKLLASVAQGPVALRDPNLHKNPGPIRSSTVPRAQLASKLTHSREFRTSDWLAAGIAQWQNLPGYHICARTAPVCSRHPHVEKGVCCRPCRQQGAMGSDLVDGRRVEAHFGVVAVVCEEVVPEVEQLLSSEHGTARHTILPPCNTRAAGALLTRNVPHALLCATYILQHASWLQHTAVQRSVSTMCQMQHATSSMRHARYRIHLATGNMQRSSRSTTCNSHDAVGAVPERYPQILCLYMSHFVCCVLHIAH